MSSVSSNLDLAPFFTIATASGTVYFFPFSRSASAAFLLFPTCAIRVPSFGFRLPPGVLGDAGVGGSFVRSFVSKSVDDVDSHRARRARDALHRGVDAARVHVGELQCGELPQLRGGDLAHF